MAQAAAKGIELPKKDAEGASEVKKKVRKKAVYGLRVSHVHESFWAGFSV